jgi:aconitate hydratase
MHHLHRKLRPACREVSQAIDEKELVVASVLSGNRNFEGRINSEVRANYLMSPPLVVAFALAGRIDIDLRKDPSAKAKTASPSTSPTSGPRSASRETMQKSITSDMFRKVTERSTKGDERWRGLPSPR